MSVFGRVSPASTVMAYSSMPGVKTGNYSTFPGEFVRVDATGGARTITLPATAAVGAVVTVQKVDASANAVIVDGFGAATVNGAATVSITTQNAAVDLVFDGANWASPLAASGGGGAAGDTVTAKTGAYTAAASEFVKADATAAGFTITLPSAPPSGSPVTVKKMDSTTNVVTVVGQGGATIDGDANAIIAGAETTVTFTYDGANWLVKSTANDRYLGSPGGQELAYVEATSDLSLTANADTDVAGFTISFVSGPRPVYVETLFPIIQFTSGPGAYGYGVYKITDAANNQRAWTGYNLDAVGRYAPGGLVHYRVPPNSGSVTYKVRYSMGDPGAVHTVLLTLGGVAFLRAREV
jgi:hypothetical protein